MDDVSKLCSNFVIDMLRDICPVEVSSRVQASVVEEFLKRRVEAGEAELKTLLQDRKRYPMTYNHYYTLVIQKIRQERNQVQFERSLKDATSTSTMYDIISSFLNFSSGPSSQIPVGMAAVSIVEPLAVAGLHVTPTISNLRESSNVYVYILYDMASSY